MRTKRHGSKVRDSIRRSLDKAPGLTNDYLSYSGILPLELPEGTSGVILPDIHYPAHHAPLMWAVTQFLGVFKPKIVISIGDLADIFAMSRHPKPLRPISNPQSEFEGTKRLWDDIMDVSEADWGYVIQGNHEDRIYRFLQELCPSMGGIVTPNNRELLNFHNLMGMRPEDNSTFLYGVEERGGFEGGLVLNGDLNLHHGIFVRPHPGQSPLADMNRWQWSVGHGHTHRAGMCSTGLMRCYEFGHLVNQDHSYLSYAHQMFPNWAPGFAVFHVVNGKIAVQPVPIQPITCADGKSRLSFVYDGKIYSESDR